MHAIAFAAYETAERTDFFSICDCVYESDTRSLTIAGDCVVDARDRSVFGARDHLQDRFRPTTIGGPALLRIDDRGRDNPVSRTQMRRKPARHSETDDAAASSLDGLVALRGTLTLRITADNDHTWPRRNAGFESHADEGDDKAVRRRARTSRLTIAGGARLKNGARHHAGLRQMGNT